MVALQIDAKQLRHLQRVVRHIENGVPKVLAPAINRALDKGRTTVRRQIRKIYVIKSKDIPVAVKGASVSRLSGEIVLKQGMLELNKFKVRPSGVQRRKNKRPVFAQVKVGGGAVMHGAFVPAGVGYVGPFIRASGAGRLPMHKLLAIGASIMATQPTVGPEVNKQMGDTLAKRIDHEIERVMAGAGRHSLWEQFLSSSSFCYSSAQCRAGAIAAAGATARAVSWASSSSWSSSCYSLDAYEHA